MDIAVATITGDGPVRAEVEDRPPVSHALNAGATCLRVCYDFVSRPKKLNSATSRARSISYSSKNENPNVDRYVLAKFVVVDVSRIAVGKYGFIPTDPRDRDHRALSIANMSPKDPVWRLSIVMSLSVIPLPVNSANENRLWVSIIRNRSSRSRFHSESILLTLASIQ